MTPGAHPIWSAAAQAWRDSVRAMKALLPVTAIALGICTGLALLQSVLSPSDSTPAPTDLVWSTVQAFLLTPYFIAVHRFIILDEAAWRYELTPSQTRFQRFFGWSIAFSLVWFVPSFIATSLARSTGMRAIVLLALAIIAAIVSIRLITLFPAIAVDAPDASWRKAADASRGRAGHIVGVLLLALLPIVFLAIMGATVAPWLSPDALSAAWTTVAAIVVGVVILLVTTIGIAVASRLYQRFGERTR